MSSIRSRVLLLCVAVLPQLLLIRMLTSKECIKSLGSRSSCLTLLALGVVTLIYWGLLFYIGHSVAAGLIAATVGSFCLTLFYYGVWDDYRRYMQTGKNDFDSDLKLAYLIAPNLELGFGLTLATPFSEQNSIQLCSFSAVLAVFLAVLTAFLLFRLSTILKQNHFVVSLPFPVPRNDFPYLGTLGAITYLFWELGAIHSNWPVTDWKIIRCFIERLQ